MLGNRYAPRLVHLRLYGIQNIQVLNLRGFFFFFINPMNINFYIYQTQYLISNTGSKGDLLSRPGF